MTDIVFAHSILQRVFQSTAKKCLGCTGENEMLREFNLSSVTRFAEGFFCRNGKMDLVYDSLDGCFFFVGGAKCMFTCYYTAYEPACGEVYE